MSYETDYLAHYGVKGQKWGVRRYQNEDGSLTDEGRKRYGYDGDPSGRFDGIKKALQTAGNKASSAIKRTAVRKKESFVARHKPVSMMSDQELNERINRLQKETNLKRLQDEASGKNKPKKTFSSKHPVLNQILVTTAVGTASQLVSNQMKVKADEILAPRRMQRAKEKGLLDRDLFPFLSPATAGRNSAYNNLESTKAKAEEAVKERIKNAVSEERKTQQGNLERAVSIATKEAKESMDREIRSTIRSVKAKDDEDLRKVLSVVRSTAKNGKGSSKEKKAVSSAVDAILKGFENRHMIYLEPGSGRKYKSDTLETYLEWLKNR